MISACEYVAWDWTLLNKKLLFPLSLLQCSKITGEPPAGRPT